MSLKVEPFKSLGAVSYSPSIVTMAVSVAVCDISSVKEWPDLENMVRVRSRSLEMAPIERSHTSLNTQVVCTHVPGIYRHKYYTVTFKSRLRVTHGHWVVPFESLGTVSYSRSIVTMAVSAAILEIFSVKEWPNLEMWVWGLSRSLKMARFDRPCMTSISPPL